MQSSFIGKCDYSQRIGAIFIVHFDHGLSVAVSWENIVAEERGCISIKGGRRQQRNSLHSNELLDLSGSHSRGRWSRRRGRRGHIGVESAEGRDRTMLKGGVEREENRGTSHNRELL